MLIKAANRNILTNKNNLIWNLKRSVYTVAGKNYIVPTSVGDLVKYLDDQRPIFTCVYFHANWNPICEKIEKDY